MCVHVCVCLCVWLAGWQHYQTAIGLCPQRASSYAALGLTQHLQGELDAAIEYYHRALGLNREESFWAELLTRALREVVEEHTPQHPLQPPGREAGR